MTSFAEPVDGRSFAEMKDERVRDYDGFSAKVLN